MAYLYNAQTGGFLRQFTGPVTSGKSEFGRTVAIEGNTIAIRSPGNFNRDDVRVYDANTGSLQWSYGYGTTGQAQYFRDIAIDGGVVVVGAARYRSKCAYALVLDRSTGALQNTIDTQVPNENDDFKIDLDVSGNRLVVGSWGTYQAPYGSFVGAANLFDITSGGFLGSITNPFPTGGDDFGFAVALEGDRLIVGAPDSQIAAV